MDIALIIGLMIPLVFSLVVLSVFLRYFRLWLAAKTSGLPVSSLDLLGMTFRKCNPKIVVETMIMAKQAGVELSCEEVQAAYLCFADLPKISAALVQAKAQGLEVSFRDLVETDLRDSGLEEGIRQFPEVLGRIRGND